MDTAESREARRARADAELEAFGYPVRQMERFLALTPLERVKAMEGWNALYRRRKDAGRRFA
jgi:hypothetical protein